MVIIENVLIQLYLFNALQPQPNKLSNFYLLLFNCCLTENLHVLHCHIKLALILTVYLFGSCFRTMAFIFFVFFKWNGAGVNTEKDKLQQLLFYSNGTQTGCKTSIQTQISTTQKYSFLMVNLSDFISRKHSTIYLERTIIKSIRQPLELFQRQPLGTFSEMRWSALYGLS